MALEDWIGLDQRLLLLLNGSNSFRPFDERDYQYGGLDTCGRRAILCVGQEQFHA